LWWKRWYPDKKHGQIKNQVGQIIAEEGASGNGGEHHTQTDPASEG
jgi:hypothetical protein